MANDMDQNKDVRVNWRTLNVPSLATIIAVGGLLWGASANLATKQERQDARLDGIEKQMAITAASDNERYRAGIDILNKMSAEMPNIIYRITAAEQQNLALGQRQDRFADAIGDMRDGIAKVNTSIEVLTERLEQVLPMQNSVDKRRAQ